MFLTTHLLDGLKDARVCELVRRPDFVGYGFSIHKNPKGPHQITNVEPNSPALASGLKNDDLLLKVNDYDVVGENYTKTILKIKNESERDRFKLTVIDPLKCPADIKNKTLDAPSGYSTVSGKSNKPKPTTTGGVTASTSNLKNITSEMINSAGDSSSTYGTSPARPVSADRHSSSTVSSAEKQRSKSSIDLSSRQPVSPPIAPSASVRDGKPLCPKEVFSSCMFGGNVQKHFSLFFLCFQSLSSQRDQVIKANGPRSRSARLRSRPARPLASESIVNEELSFIRLIRNRPPRQPKSSQTTSFSTLTNSMFANKSSRKSEISSREPVSKLRRSSSRSSILRASNTTRAGRTSSGD